MKRSSPMALAAVLVLSLAGCGGTGSSAGPKPSGDPASTATPPTTSPAAPGPPTHASASYASWRLPLKVSRAAVIVLGEDPRRTLLAGGMLAGDTSTDRVTALDLPAGHARPAPALAVPVHDAAGGLVNRRPAVFGGGNSTEQSVVQALSGSAWRPVTRLPTTRSDLSVATTGGRSLVIGGYDGVHVPREILLAGRRLTPHGALATGVRYAATAVVGPSAYVIGGEVDHQELDLVQRVDLSTGHTTVVARLPRPLGHASAVTVEGRILILGGVVSPDHRTPAMWWYDPDSGRFTRAGRLPVAVSDASAVAGGRRVWLLGGETPGVTDRVVQVTVS